MKRSKRDKAKELFWRKAVVRFAESGLSQSAFCQREGLNANNFSWWKRTIVERDGDKAELAPLAAGNPFVQLIPPASDPQQDRQHPDVIAEIDLDRRTVRIFKGASGETLQVLIAALQEVST